MGMDQEDSNLNGHIRHSLQEQVHLYPKILSAQIRSGLFWVELEEEEEKEAEEAAVCALWLQA